MMIDRTTLRTDNYVSALDGSSGAHRGEASEDTAGSSLLPEPGELARLMDSGDMTAVLAALMSKMSREERQASQRNEVAAADAAWAAGERKVQALHEKAEHILHEGIIEGVSLMAQGAASIGTGAVNAERTKVYIKGSGELFAGAAKPFAASERAAQTLDDARIARADRAKDVADRFAKIHSDSASDARDMMRKICEWFLDMKRTKESTLQAAIHRA